MITSGSGGVFERAVSGGERRAVTLKESDGISYRDETDVVKQCEEIV